MMGRKSEKQRAFEQMVVVYTDVLYRYGVRLAGNAADAEALVQETYLKAYRFWDRYDQGTNIRGWLFRILKNSFIAMYRKRSKEPDMLMESEVTRRTSANCAAVCTNTLQELTLNSLLDEDVSRAMAGLPEDFRTVVILCDIEGLAYEEIARFVDCPLGTVRSRLHRGRKLLHAALQDYAKERGFGRTVQSSVEALQLVLES